MLRILTYVAPSSIHGLGLFTARDLRQGEQIGCWVDGVDLFLAEREVALLPQLMRQTIRHFAYLERRNGRYCLNADNMRFMNHSATPNVAWSCMDIAACDIPAGTELTCDYYKFDDEADYKLKGPELAELGGELTERPHSCPWCGEAFQSLDMEILRYACDTTIGAPPDNFRVQSDRCKLICAERRVISLEEELCQLRGNSIG